ncbi:hypothetical protein E2C01_034286 [Portunus trituberculatus]|uniref:Uncharacterized protein n=1 Tax=Portunus trituberculatus TaxID=210409 RepID=A0A5B7F0A8_PORTR|nr:hypothetical protein [Portunus trituberculatus]
MCFRGPETRLDTLKGNIPDLADVVQQSTRKYYMAGLARLEADFCAENVKSLIELDNASLHNTVSFCVT